MPTQKKRPRPKHPKQAVERAAPAIASAAPGRTQIRILCQELRTNDLYDLGDGPIIPVGGFGGWEEITIPGQVNVTEYVGVETLKLDIPILLDGFADNQSQEPKLHSLMRLARQFEDGDEPPVVQIFGAAMPVANGGHFIILGFDFDPGMTILNQGGTLVRRSCIMHVSEFSDADTVRIKKRKKKRGNKGGGTQVPPSHYTIKSDDTLFSIAMKFYGDRSAWERIAKANGLRDPRNPPAGKKIKLPV